MMHAEFSWVVEDEGEHWGTVDAIETREGSPVSPWLWISVALVLLLSGGGCFALWRYQKVAIQRTAFQIQNVIDLEAQTLARGDIDRYLRQQDAAALGWIAWQAQLARDHRAQADPDATHGKATVQDIELRGDVAWVEVAVGREHLRQARFYRQTELGWVHTMPHVRFWGDLIERADGRVTVRAHERDWPYVQPLVRVAREALEDVCTALTCPPGRGLEIRVVPAAGQTPGLLGDAIIVPSLWLTGIPATGTWHEYALAEVRYWAAYLAARKAMDPPRYYDLSPRQRAVLSEYAALYAAGDPSAAFVLPHVVA